MRNFKLIPQSRSRDHELVSFFSVEGVGNYCCIVINKRFGETFFVNRRGIRQRNKLSSEQYVADSKNVNCYIKSGIIAAAGQYCAVARERVKLEGRGWLLLK